MMTAQMNISVKIVAVIGLVLGGSLRNGGDICRHT
jgi:hypothetical protein